MKEVYDVSSGKTYFLSEDGHGNYYALDIPQNGNGYLIFLILLYGSLLIWSFISWNNNQIVTKDFSEENNSSSYSTDYSSSDTKFPEYYYSNADD